MKRTLCLNQLVRPKISFKIGDVGDCKFCKPDEKNKECKNYKPITIIEELILEGKDKENAVY